MDDGTPKITEVQTAVCDYVWIDGMEWQRYTRHSAGSWTVLMGESDEPIYDENEVKRLESMFEDYQEDG